MLYCVLLPWKRAFVFPAFTGLLVCPVSIKPDNHSLFNGLIWGLPKLTQSKNPFLLWSVYNDMLSFSEVNDFLKSLGQWRMRLYNFCEIDEDFGPSYAWWIWILFWVCFLFFKFCLTLRTFHPSAGLVNLVATMTRTVCFEHSLETAWNLMKGVILHFFLHLFSTHLLLPLWVFLGH